MTTEKVSNSAVRKLEVVKRRGMPVVQGLHSFRIDEDGIHVYPRIGPAVTKQVPKRKGRAKFRCLDIRPRRAGAEWCISFTPKVGKSTPGDVAPRTDQ